MQPADRPVVLVCGLGRCGSSLVMQMLSACGLYCSGTYPMFEDDVVFGPESTPDIEDFTDHDAVKVLIPHKAHLPRGLRCVIIWLDRDVREQTRSQMKVFRTVSTQQHDPAHWQAFLEHDRELAIAAIRGVPRIELTFEDLLAHPESMAADIAEFLGRWGVRVDWRKMAQCVVQRGPECQADLTMELKLMKMRRAE